MTSINWQAKYDELNQRLQTLASQESVDISTIGNTLGKIENNINNKVYLTKDQLATEVQALIDSGEIDVNDKITDDNVQARLTRLLNEVLNNE